jgi:hypothetical protein
MCRNRDVAVDVFSHHICRFVELDQVPFRHGSTDFWI